MSDRGGQVAFAFQWLPQAQGGHGQERGRRGFKCGEEPDNELGWGKGCGRQGGRDRVYAGAWGP